MPAPHDLDPPAMTEKERLAKRRYQAFFVFETMPTGTKCARCGTTDCDDQICVDNSMTRRPGPGLVDDEQT